MAGLDIQARVMLGLAKANLATGNGSSVVYLIKETDNGGTPINPIAPTIENITLTDAVVKSINNNLVDNTLVFATDSMLISNGEVEIKQGDRISVNGSEMKVVSVTVSKPYDVVLSYTSVIRA